MSERTRTASKTTRRTGAASAGPPRYETLAISDQHGVRLIALNRPDVHNAFDERMIAELDAALAAADGDAAVRAVVLLGAGESFCAGADLRWMKRMAGFSREQNVADAMGLARMLHRLANLRKPTVARVHGGVFGGGVGLVAACDIAIAAQDAVFSMSEAKLGLIPATVGPYVVDAIGARAARRFFMTAERFAAAEAFRIGLVHDLAPLDALDERIDEVLARLLEAAPGAQAAAKALVRDVAGRPVDEAMVAFTAQRIAELRASDEGREGVAAFLGKRRPSWAPAE